MSIIDKLFNFEGKVIIIAGGSGAIDTATGHLLAPLGANIVISDLRGEDGKVLLTQHCGSL